MQGPGPFGDVPAVQHSGKTDVCDEQVNLLPAFQHLHGLLSCGRFKYLPASIAQAIGDTDPDEELVFHNKSDRRYFLHDRYSPKGNIKESLWAAQRGKISKGNSEVLLTFINRNKNFFHRVSRHG